MKCYPGVGSASGSPNGDFEPARLETGQAPQTSCGVMRGNRMLAPREARGEQPLMPWEGAAVTRKTPGCICSQRPLVSRL
jgi:hypothetical protein